MKRVLFMNQNSDTVDWLVRSSGRSKAEELGIDLIINDSCQKLETEEWKRRIRGCDALLTTWGSPVLSAEMFGDAKPPAIICHVAGSIANSISPDIFDLGIRVCTANQIMARSVAESSLMLMLMGLRQVHVNARLGTRSEPMIWGRNPHIRTPEDCVIGLWGFGDVAQHLNKLLKPFTPGEILVHAPHLDRKEAAKYGITLVGFDELCSKSDVLFALAGMTPENYHRIDDSELSLMKDHALLVNPGRSRLVNTTALVEELKTGRITAALDVYDNEPLDEAHPLCTLPNVIMTPHNAGTGRDGNYLPEMLEEVDRFFKGAPLRYEVDRSKCLNMTRTFKAPVESLAKTVCESKL